MSIKFLYKRIVGAESNYKEVSKKNYLHYYQIMSAAASADASEDAVENPTSSSEQTRRVCSEVVRLALEQKN